jgi:hypothetical protein
MFGRRFWRARRRIERSNTIRRKRRKRRTRIGITIISRGRQPVMGAKDTVDITRAGQDSAIRVLMDADTIKVADQTRIGEGRGRFARELELATNLIKEGDGNVFGGGSQGKIVNLTDTTKETGINQAILCSGLERESGRCQDGIDMMLPETTGFRMTLKCMLYRENKRTVEIHTKTEEVPFMIRIVNSHKSWRLRRRRVGEGISGISTIGLIIQQNAKSEEQPLNILLNTGRISLSKTMEHWGSHCNKVEHVGCHIA